VPSFLLALDAVRRALSLGLFAIGAALAVVCFVDWLVRTRRLNPFGKVARFFRERWPLDGAGGAPDRAWGGGLERPVVVAGVVVLGGIVFLSLSDFVRGQIGAFYFACRPGRGILRMLIQWTFAILRFALIVRVICSWVRISPYSRWVRWAFTLSEPILRPLRQIVPTLGMIDITPIIAYLVLGLLEGFLVGMT
jgi:YggT family protein